MSDIKWLKFVLAFNIFVVICALVAIITSNRMATGFVLGAAIAKFLFNTVELRVKIKRLKEEK